MKVFKESLMEGSIMTQKFNKSPSRNYRRNYQDWRLYGKVLKTLREKLKHCDGNKKMSEKGDKIDVVAIVEA